MPIHYWPMRKDISPTSVSLGRMISAITETIRRNYRLTEKFSVKSYAKMSKAMTQLDISRQMGFIPHTHFYPFKVDELPSVIEVKKRGTFDALIERRHGATTRPSNVSPSSNDEGGTLPEPWFAYQDKDEQPRLILWCGCSIFHWEAYMSAAGIWYDCQW